MTAPAVPMTVDDAPDTGDQALGDEVAQEALVVGGPAGSPGERTGTAAAAAAAAALSALLDQPEGRVDDRGEQGEELHKAKHGSNVVGGR